jgi:hypothetical protein
MITTINILEKEFEEIQKAHYQLNSFYFGELNLALQNRSLLYPLLAIDYNSGNINELNTNIQFVMVIADKVYKDNSNLTETKSDTLQICRDIFNLLKKSKRWTLIGRVSNANISAFVERGKDEIAGHVLTFSLELRDSNGICDLPLNGYDYGGILRVPCEDAHVFNSDSTYSADVPAGGTLILPDMVFDVFVNSNFKEQINLITLSA